MAVNRNPQQRGFQRNGAPTGYGQQRGQSPFLDRAQGEGEEEARLRMAHEPMAPSAPALPEPPQPPPVDDFASTLAPMQEQPGVQPAFMTALQRPSAQRQPMTAANPNALPGRDQFQTSTGAGAFGAGARLPQAQQFGGLKSEAQAQQEEAAGTYDPNDPQWAARMGAQQPQVQPGFSGGQPDLGAQQPEFQSRFGAQIGVGPSQSWGTGDIPGAETVQPGQFVGQLRGFNTQGWGTGERGTNSIKNTFGKIASRYEAKPSSISALFADPDFQEAFPNARIVEGGAGDKIDIGDGVEIDILESADPNSDTSNGWAWMPNDGGGFGGPVDQTMGAQQGAVGGPGGDQLSAMLQAALQGGGGQFGDGSVNIQQLLESLGLQQQAQPFLGNSGQPQF